MKQIDEKMEALSNLLMDLPPLFLLPYLSLCATKKGIRWGDLNGKRPRSPHIPLFI
jgi:hypothetical protein